MNIENVCAGLGRNNESQIADTLELLCKKFFLGFVKKAQTDLIRRHTHLLIML